MLKLMAALWFTSNNGFDALVDPADTTPYSMSTYNTAYIRTEDVQRACDLLAGEFSVRYILQPDGTLVNERGEVIVPVVIEGETRYPLNWGWVPQSDFRVTTVYNQLEMVPARWGREVFNVWYNPAGGAYVSHNDMERLVGEHNKMFPHEMTYNAERAVVTRDDGDNIYPSLLMRNGIEIAYLIEGVWEWI